MTDFFEIDFLDVETDVSGDAITVRYEINGETAIHVVDAGYQVTGESVVDHLNTYYGNDCHVNRVIVSHSDGDHSGGIPIVLQQCDIGELWMLRPWIYAAEIKHRFKDCQSTEQLERAIREAYPRLAEIEEVAHSKNIPIYEPFQGTKIGAFTVMAPSRDRYLTLVVESDKTPEHIADTASALAAAYHMLARAAVKIASLVKAAWGEETFSSDDISAENEMSVIQYGELCGKKILLTADGGRGALDEAANFAPYVNLQLPGIDRFQVPHHGSRRNLSTDLLDRWLGQRLSQQLPKGQELFTAIISSAKKDVEHPRKSVVRAMIHRGGRVVSTEGNSVRTSVNAPHRDWGPAEPMAYPEEQED
ncbi:MAG: competence protein ComEC [Pirellula sp.]|nr:competence protein ComEC [Pirellula sp.]